MAKRFTFRSLRAPGAGAAVMGLALSNLRLDLPDVVLLAVLFVGVVMFVLSFLDPPKEDEKLGPAELAEAARGLVTLKQAFFYAICGAWNRSDLNEDERLIWFNHMARDFEMFARDGALTIWGTEHQNGAVPGRIPADVWREQQIERLSMHTDEAKTECRAIQPAYDHGRFYHLQVNFKDVEALYRWRFFTRLKRWLRERKNALTAS